jgi:hypothetical protein
MPSHSCDNDGMVRMQVQFTEEQAAALRKMAAQRGRSIADLVREGVDELIARGQRRYTPEQVERMLAFAGGASSGQPGSNVAVEHDKYLDEIYGDFLERR